MPPRPWKGKLLSLTVLAFPLEKKYGDIEQPNSKYCAPHSSYMDTCFVSLSLQRRTSMLSWGPEQCRKWCRCNETAISLKAGCQLFLRYITRTSALEMENFEAAKARIIEVSITCQLLVMESDPLVSHPSHSTF